PAASGWKVWRKLTQERALIHRLLATGDALLASGHDAGFASRLRDLRILGAQLSSVTNDAAGQMTRQAQASLNDLVRVEVLLGALGALAAVSMGVLLRVAGQRQSARFRSLVHNASDLITV